MGKEAGSIKLMDSYMQVTEQKQANAGSQDFLSAP